MITIDCILNLVAMTEQFVYFSWISRNSTTFGKFLCFEVNVLNHGSECFTLVLEEHAIGIYSCSKMSFIIWTFAKQLFSVSSLYSDGISITNTIDE
jgi:hypothetical protein